MVSDEQARYKRTRCERRAQSCPWKRALPNASARFFPSFPSFPSFPASSFCAHPLDGLACISCFVYARGVAHLSGL